MVEDEFPMRPKELGATYCEECKTEWKNDDRSREDILEATKMWYVQRDGSVVYIEICPDGHERRRRNRPMNGKHRHLDSVVPMDVTLLIRNTGTNSTGTRYQKSMRVIHDSR